MKSTEDMEKFVTDAKPHVTSGEAMDKRVLQDSFAAMDETRAAIKPGRVCKIPSLHTLTWSRVCNKLHTLPVSSAAAAAVIILVTGLLLMPQRHTPNQPAPQPAAHTPARMLSMMSLRTAYQRGGWDALDRQFRDTLNQFGPASSSLSMQQLLEGSNGS